jgi:hypothetical protein
MIKAEYNALEMAVYHGIIFDVLSSYITPGATALEGEDKKSEFDYLKETLDHNLKAKTWREVNVILPSLMLGKIRQRLKELKGYEDTVLVLQTERNLIITVLLLRAICEAKGKGHILDGMIPELQELNERLDFRDLISNLEEYHVDQSLSMSLDYSKNKNNLQILSW